jgi:Flp pilus assembly protein TadD
MGRSSTNQAPNSESHLIHPTQQLLGSALRAQGKSEEAVSEFRRVIELKPSGAEGYSGLALVQLIQGQTDEALVQGRKAIELEPDNEDAHLAVGFILMVQGKSEEAVSEYRRVVELTPLRAAGLGLLYPLLAPGQSNEALIEGRRAVELNPGNVGAYLALGSLLLAHGENDVVALTLLSGTRTDILIEACEVLLAGSQLAPNSPWFSLAVRRVDVKLQPQANCPPRSP